VALRAVQPARCWRTGEPTSIHSSDASAATPFAATSRRGSVSPAEAWNLNIAMANRGKRSPGRRPAPRARQGGAASVFWSRRTCSFTNFRPGALHRLGLEAENLDGAVSAPGLRARTRDGVRVRTQTQAGSTQLPIGPAVVWRAS